MSIDELGCICWWYSVSFTVPSGKHFTCTYINNTHTCAKIKHLIIACCKYWNKISGCVWLFTVNDFHFLHIPLYRQVMLGGSWEKNISYQFRNIRNWFQQCLHIIIFVWSVERFQIVVSVIKHSADEAHPDIFRRVPCFLYQNITEHFSLAPCLI